MDRQAVTNFVLSRIETKEKMMGFTIKVIAKKQVKYLLAECGVRYWEDATVNGVDDKNGDLIPCRDGDLWRPLIDIETGKILNWEQGKTAQIHYKVCDEGVYKLLDEERNVVAVKDGYVARMMCPEGEGYGDYIIMRVDENGMIDKWKVDIKEFEQEEE